MKKAIGAMVEMKYCDEPDREDGYEVYISIVDYAEDADFDDDNLTDLAGVPDRLIYFCTNDGGEESLKELLNPDNGEDFFITNYELVYDKDDVSKWY
jgi:hypothetical protein